MLNGSGAGALADGLEQRVALLAVIVEDPDLDQFVAPQAAFYFRGNCFGESGTAYDDYRLERMRPRSESASLDCGQL